MFDWKYLFLVALIPVIIVLSGCVTKEETIKIGVIMPLTGELGNLGTDMKDAVVMATDEINANGGINGAKIEVIVEDTQCDPAKATPAAQKLITIDKVLAVVGPTCSGESLATAKLFADAKISNMSPSATAITLTEQGGDYWFRDVPSDGFQAKIAADYATKKWAAKTSAILYLKNDWGVGLQDNFEKAFTELGGKVLLKESFDTEVTDAKAQLMKIKDLNPDMLYLPCFPKECSVILKQATELGLKIDRIIAPDGANDPKAYVELGASLNGFTTTIASNATGDFPAKYKAKFGKEAGAYCGQSYDALKVLAKAIEKAGTDGEKVKDALYATDYDGATGKIKFDKFGDLTSAKYDLFVWDTNTLKLSETVEAQ